MMGRLAGRVAIVTGAASGIGRAAAERFSSEGAAVVCADLAGAADTVATIRDAGGLASDLRVDVRRQEDTEAMVRHALETHGGCDVLLANAGVPGLGSTSECDPDVWAHVLDVNLTGTWLSMRAVLPTMVEQGHGSVICTASAAGVVGVRGIAPYSASKAGVIGLVRGTAVEVGPHNVRVNALAPGTSPTPLVTRTFETMVGAHATSDPEARTSEALRREQRRYPMQRFGSLEEIASVALFLASDDSTWVTGTVQMVDGGLTCA